MAHSQLAQSFGEHGDTRSVINAHDLRGSARGIRQRAEQVENRLSADFPARGHGMAHRGMHRRRKQKAKSDLLDRGASAFGR